MAELKTKPSDESVAAFLNRVEDEQQRADSLALLGLMRRVTRQEPRLWGGGMVGFGDYHYRYASGHEGDTFVVGFSPRKREISLYVTCSDFPGRQALLDQLGKHKTGKACIYIKRLTDVDKKVLEQIIREGVKAARATKQPKPG